MERKTFYRLASEAAIDSGGGTATKAASSTFILSTPEVVRDGNTIAGTGWHLANYQKNPVVLWQHRSDLPPIGRSRVWAKNGNLYGTISYADTPFAQEVAGLVKGGFLNAASVSWTPLEWRYATAPGRAPGAIDFLEQELLEWSIVSIPADTNAVAIARQRSFAASPNESLLRPSGRIAPLIYVVEGRLFDLRNPDETDAYLRLLNARTRRRKMMPG